MPGTFAGPEFRGHFYCRCGSTLLLVLSAAVTISSLAAVRRLMEPTPLEISLFEALQREVPRLGENQHRGLAAVARIGALLPQQSLLEEAIGLLQKTLPSLAFPSEALDCFAAWIEAARSAPSFVSLLRHDIGTFHGLLKVAVSSPALAADLTTDPEVFDLLRITGGQPTAREFLVDEILAECRSAASASHVQSILRRFRRRERLRIAYGEIVAGIPQERTGQQLAFLADAILTASMAWGEAHAQERLRAKPLGSSAIPRCAAIAVGSYGGLELDFGNQLEVLFVSPDWIDIDCDQETYREHVAQTVEMTLMLLGADGQEPPLYEIPGRLRIKESLGQICQLTELQRYFETSGRTWQRQLLLQARYVAGDAPLAQQILDRLTPWIYRRYLGSLDQEGIRAIQRKLTRPPFSSDFQGPVQTQPEEAAAEIARFVQMLQLLHGCDLPAVRVGGTLRAIEALEQTGCLTMQERGLLAEHYGMVQRVHYRLQLALAQPPAKPPHPSSSPTTVRPWVLSAGSLGFLDLDGAPDEQSLQRDVQQRRAVCRRIMDHLIHEVFPDAGEIPLETEMILDPDFDFTTALETIARYGFTQPESAWNHLLSLASEPIRFLSERRSRHFLAGIAPKLLTEIATTPYPDDTLTRLGAVSDSLGGKAALWELFQTTPSTLRLCIRLCAAHPYLTNLLTNNPGMLDELIDSLLLDRLPTSIELENHSLELCRFAEDLDPILHSFKNSAHLRIGVRDSLGRDSIQETHRRLADTAEACLRRVTEYELQQAIDQYGEPQDSLGQPCHLAMVALGRLGGREPNYHSDLDVLFLYDADGQTRPRGGGRREGTSNSHFFNELAKQIHKRIGHYGPLGCLYEIDCHLRLSHHRGLLAVTLAQFQQHFASPHAPLWQRLALVSARVVFGNERMTALANLAIRDGLLAQPWHESYTSQIASLRLAAQQGAATENLKRGLGGTMDVEAIVQMLLLRHARDFDGRLGVGTLEGLEWLRSAGHIDVEPAQQLASSYRYLRYVESNLRLMDLPARHDLPRSSDHLRWLAYALREPHPGTVLQKCSSSRESNRHWFESLVPLQSQESRLPAPLRGTNTDRLG